MLLEVLKTFGMQLWLRKILARNLGLERTVMLKPKLRHLKLHFFYVKPMHLNLVFEHTKLRNTNCLKQPLIQLSCIESTPTRSWISFILHESSTSVLDHFIHLEGRCWKGFHFFLHLFWINLVRLNLFLMAFHLL